MIITIDTPSTKEVTVCDLCTNGDDNDDILKKYQIPFVGDVDMHRRCYAIIKGKFVNLLGLKTK